METILRLRCDDVLGGAIDRETPTGLVTIATVERRDRRLVVRLTPQEDHAGLEHLDGIQAQDCNDLQRRLEGPDVAVTMPTA